MATRTLASRKCVRRLRRFRFLTVINLKEDDAKPIQVRELSGTLRLTLWIELKRMKMLRFRYRSDMPIAWSCHGTTKYRLDI